MSQHVGGMNNRDLPLERSTQLVLIISEDRDNNEVPVQFPGGYACWSRSPQ
jgi:hypothetical protein